jgi:hypothetical protein
VSIGDGSQICEVVGGDGPVLVYELSRAASRASNVVCAGTKCSGRRRSLYDWRRSVFFGGNIPEAWGLDVSVGGVLWQSGL